MSNVWPVHEGSSVSQRSAGPVSPTGGLPFETLLDIIVDGVAVFDADWRITYLNTVAERLLGRQREELLGQVLWAVQPQSRSSVFGAAFLRAMSEGVSLTVEDFSALLGGWFEVRVVPRDGHLVVLFQDVTARHHAEAAREKSAARLALLQAVTTQLSAAASADEVLDVIVRSVTVAVGADGVSVGLPEPDGRTLRLVGTQGFSPELVRKYELLPLDAELPITRAFRSGEPEWLGSLADFEAHFPLLVDDVRTSPSQSLACLPMRAKGVSLAALALTFAPPRTFDEEDRAFMMALADQGALALDRALLFDQAQAARAEAESQRSRLHTLVMEVPAAVRLMRGPKHVIELDNPLHRELHQGRDFTGLPVRQALPHLEELGLFEVIDRVYTRGESYSERAYPLRMDLHGGGAVEERFYNFSYQPLRDGTGRVDGVALFAYDVTDHVRAMREVEVLAGRQRFLSEASTLLVGSLDYTTTLQSLTRLAVPELADWCAVDMLTEDGRVERLEVAHQNPARVELVRGMLRQQPIDLSAPSGAGRVLRTGESTWMSHVPEEALVASARTPEILRQLREIGLCSYLCVPLVARGRVLGSLTLAHAESGRHYSEADLRLVEELARRAALCVDNSGLYRESREAIRLRDEFLSIASHELKTPLTSLRLQLSLIERLLGEASRERLGGRLDTAHRQVDRLSTLVNTLLDVSRIVTGHIALELVEVDLTRLVQEALERLREVFEQAGCAVTLQARGAVVGRWDALRLDQVIVNLLTNAAKYGQGRPILVTVEATAERARLIVRDEGIGIAAEDLPRLFGRFERAVSVRHYGGLGLGLYISRQLIDALGGRVSVDSRPREGSTFTVELPRSGPGR